ncbi:Smr/MutS family protein [Xanthomonadaceae bacterium XH05]|nr:Smr/MutS family protein [Xanthomonadaceae bacterium XH05]
MPKRRSPPPSSDDIALFHEAIGPVRKLPEPVPEPARPAPPAPRPRSHERDEAEALFQSRFEPFAASPLGPGDTLEYLRDGYPPRLLRQLKRGQYAVQDEIDLHRLTQMQAEALLREFLARGRREGRRCVRIVHGKGLRSGDPGPVLKALVDRMLRLRADVIAFASAQMKDGGSGAVLVLLTRD